MRIWIHKRVKRGWESRQIEATPDEVRELKAKAAILRQRKGEGDFEKLKFGEEIAGTASGTITELLDAGCELPGEAKNNS